MKKLYLLFLLFISLSASAQISNCLSFDGAYDYVYIGDTNDLGTSDFTLEAWVYLKDLYQSTKIVNKGLTTSGTPINAGYALRTSYYIPGEAEFQIGDISGIHTSIRYSGLALKEWYHFAGVREGKYLYFYIDGVLVGQDSTEFVFNTNTNIPLTIGAMYKIGGNWEWEYFDGYIDEVRIWNVARSAEEIREHKSCAIDKPTENLLAVYNFNQNFGRVVIDASGHENHGAFVGEPIWTNSPVAPHCSAASVGEGNFQTDVRLFPNPVQDDLYIEGLAPNTWIKVYNSKGMQVLETMMTNDKIDLNYLEPGLYVVSAILDNKVMNYKIAKK